MNIEQQLARFAQAKPRIIELFKKMNQASVRWAIFAGSEASLLTGNRVPTDLDIIVHNDDFEALATLLPQAERADEWSFPVVASDGEQLNCIASTLTTTIDDSDLDVMSRAKFETREGTFPIHFTDLAVSQSLKFEVEGVTIFLANAFDTIIIKAFMRRGPEQNKFDLPDAQALVQATPLDQKYVEARSAEVGLSSGAKLFLEKL